MPRIYFTDGTYEDITHPEFLKTGDHWVEVRVYDPNGAEPAGIDVTMRSYPTETIKVVDWKSSARPRGTALLAVTS